MNDSASRLDTESREEIFTLVQQLTTEVLHRKPDNIYECCALYLERKLRNRNALKMTTVQLIDERKLMKLRLNSKSSSESTSTSSESSLASMQKPKKQDEVKKKGRKKHASKQASESLSLELFPNIISSEKKRESSQIRSSSFDGDTYRTKKPITQSQTYLSDSEKETKAHSRNRKIGFFGKANGFSHENIDIQGQSARQSSPPTLFQRSRTNSASSEGSSYFEHNTMPWLNKETMSTGQVTDDSCSLDSYTTPNTNITPLDSFTDARFLISNKSSGYSSDGESSRGSLWTPTKEADVHPECIVTFRGHKDAVTHCHIVDDEYVISSSLDTTISIWNILSGKRLKTLKCLNAVHDFKYIPVNNESILLAGLEDGKILVWKIMERGDLLCKLLGEYSGHQPNPIRSMAITVGLSRLATGCCFIMTQLSRMRGYNEAVRGTLKLWDLQEILKNCLRRDGATKDKGPLKYKTMQQLITAPTVQKYITNNNKGFVSSNMAEKSWGIRALAFTPNGEHLVVGFGHPDDEAVLDDKMIIICDAANLNTLWVDMSSIHQVNYVDFLLLQSVALTDSVNWEMLISTQRALLKMTIGCLSKDLDVALRWSQASEADHYCGRVSPSGTVVASGIGSTLTFRDAYSGKILKEIPAHKNDITRLCFSQNGSFICTASDDNTLKLWNVPTGPKWEYAKSVPDYLESGPSKVGSS